MTALLVITILSLLVAAGAVRHAIQLRDDLAALRVENEDNYVALRTTLTEWHKTSAALKDAERLARIRTRRNAPKAAEVPHV